MHVHILLHSLASPTKEDASPCESSDENYLGHDRVEMFTLRELIRSRKRAIQLRKVASFLLGTEHEDYDWDDDVPRRYVNQYIMARDQLKIKLRHLQGILNQLNPRALHMCKAKMSLPST